MAGITFRCRIIRLVSIFAVFTALSCGPELVFDESGIQNDIHSILQVTEDKNISVAVTSDGGRSSVKFHANRDWQVEPVNSRAGSWVSVSPAKGGKGDATISFQTSANKEYEERNASFILRCDDISRTIVVTQKQKHALLVSPGRIEVPSEGGYVEIEVRHTAGFNYQIPPSAEEWISPSATRGISDDRLAFVISENTDKSARSAIITFTSETGSERVTVLQQAFIPKIILSEQDFQIGQGAEVVTVEVASNVDVEYHVQEGSDWLSELVTRSMSTSTYMFMAEPNETYDQRAARIVFKEKGGSTSESVTVTQMQKEAIVLAKSKYSVPKDASELKIQILANVTPDIEVPDWMHVITTKGLEERSVLISVDENTGGTVRTGEIVFTRGALKQTAYVTQSAGYGYLERIERYTTLPRESVTAINFHVLSDRTSGVSTVSSDGLPVYCETTGTVLDFYTEGDKYEIGVHDYFSGCASLTSLDLSCLETSGLQDMSMMFDGCRSLESLDLSSFDTGRVQDMSYMFRGCHRLRDLDLSSFDVSFVSHFTGMLYDTGLDGRCRVRCSAATKKAVILHNGLDGSAGQIIWDLTDEEQIYGSSDFSQDRSVEIMQKAAEGNGIDLIFMGDGYTDMNIADGTYSSDMHKAMEALFSEEPYKSLRDLFNVYMVKAVSYNEGYEGETVFNGAFGEGSQVSGDDNLVIDYALEAIPEARLSDCTIAVLMNARKYAGTTYMYYYNGMRGDYGNGFAIAYIPLCRSAAEFNGTFVHEVGGHGFAKLGDEYFYSSKGTVSEEARESCTMLYKDLGWYKNVDFTIDLELVKWSKFIKDSRFSSERIGIYEGAFTYMNGAYRPTDNSIMKYNTDGFNAPSREAIYYRACKLAYGQEWEYDYETFVSRFKPSGTSSNSHERMLTPSIASHGFTPTAQPVVREYNPDSKNR